MHGLYLLWWVQERQIPPAAVAAILAAGDFAKVFLEIPTGWLADRFGHRASLILGSIVQVAGMVCCWLGRGMPALVVASVLVALGDAFRSGADEALLYRSCAALNREDEFQRIEARARTAELVALVGLTLTGGVIVSMWGFAAGWLAETALCALGLAFAWGMTEVPGPIEQQNDSASVERGRIVSAALAILIVPAACLGAAAGAAAFIAQTSGIGGPQKVAWLVAAITLIEAAGSAIAARLPPTGVRTQIILAATGGVLLAAGLALPALFYASVFSLSWLIGVAHPLRAAAIQRLANDGARAQAASAASACDMAVSTIALPAAGIWRGRR